MVKLDELYIVAGPRHRDEGEAQRAHRSAATKMAQLGAVDAKDREGGELEAGKSSSSGGGGGKQGFAAALATKILDNLQARRCAAHPSPRSR